MKTFAYTIARKRRRIYADTRERAARIIAIFSRNAWALDAYEHTQDTSRELAYVRALNEHKERAMNESIDEDRVNEYLTRRVAEIKGEARARSGLSLS